MRGVTEWIWSVPKDEDQFWDLAIGNWYWVMGKLGHSRVNLSLLSSPQLAGHPSGSPTTCHRVWVPLWNLWLPLAKAGMNCPSMLFRGCKRGNSLVPCSLKSWQLSCEWEDEVFTASLRHYLPLLCRSLRQSVKVSFSPYIRNKELWDTEKS